MRMKKSNLYYLLPYSQQSVFLSARLLLDDYGYGPSYLPHTLEVRGSVSRFRGGDFMVVLALGASQTMRVYDGVASQGDYLQLRR